MSHSSSVVPLPNVLAPQKNGAASLPHQYNLVKRSLEALKEQQSNGQVEHEPKNETQYASNKNDSPNTSDCDRRPVPSNRRPRVYQRVVKALDHDPVILKELSNGKRIGFYRIRRDLGAGNFSRVKLAANSVTKDLVALKIIDKTRLDQKASKLLSQEIENMQLLFHSRIVMLYEVIENLSQLALVVEYADSGDLYTKVTENGRLLEPEAKAYYVQILDAVHYMHKNHIIHRDIKSENVYLHQNGTKVKIGDLGFSTRVISHDQKLTTFCGSPPYAAPELFRDEKYIGTYVDVWALGVLLYFLVCGRTPFRADNVPDLKQLILKGEFKIPTQLSGDCQDLISHILEMNPRERLTIQQMKSHAWLEDSNVTLTTASSDECAGSTTGSTTGGGGGMGNFLIPMTLNFDSSMTHLPRGITHVASEELKQGVIGSMCEEFGMDEAEVKRVVLTEEKIRHPIMGIFRITLHEAAKGTRNRATKKVTIRSPEQSIIERRETEEQLNKGGNFRWPSRLCTIL